MEGDPIFKVPEVIDELTTGRVITMELINGVPLDGCVDLDQETRNKVSPCGIRWKSSVVFRFSWSSQQVIYLV